MGIPAVLLRVIGDGWIRLRGPGVGPYTPVLVRSAWIYGSDGSIQQWRTCGALSDALLLDLALLNGH